jgi:SAM-dependent methyltransferase
MPKARKKSRFTARTADRHELYQLSVQAADYEVSFLNRLYRSHYGEKPLTMREDFCGTALLSAAWVESHSERTATGVDFHRPTLEWGRKRNVEPLGKAAERVTLTLGDVRTPRSGKFQIINALNFSYWVFETRAGLRDYFKVVRKGLAKDGLFLCDAYGGWEAQEPMLEPRRIPAGFVYVWDQHSFDPITQHVVNHIHFEFQDGTKMQKAFTYEWRFWTLPEIKELLLEAGFREVLVYWDKAKSSKDESYRPSTRAENQPGWLAYIVALP